MGCSDNNTIVDESFGNGGLPDPAGAKTFASLQRLLKAYTLGWPGSHTRL